MPQALSEYRSQPLFYGAWSHHPQFLDSKVFAQVYDCYAVKIYKYIRRKIGTPVEAEDLTSQVFMKAWQASGRYRWTERPLSAWLYRIAHNLVVDYFRTQRNTVSIDDVPIDLDTGEDSLDTIAQRKWTADRLYRAVSQLTDSQKQVIVLKFLEGYTTEEIAGMLGKDIGAVRALQCRALSALRKTWLAEKEVSLC